MRGHATIHLHQQGSRRQRLAQLFAVVDDLPEAVGLHRLQQFIELGIHTTEHCGRAGFMGFVAQIDAHLQADACEDRDIGEVQEQPAK